MSLRHRNVVRVIGTTEAMTCVAHVRRERLVLMEYAGCRNLLSIINDESEKIPTRRRLKFATDVANALCYIHGQKVAHLDVKPANIVVSFRWVEFTLSWAHIFLYSHIKKSETRIKRLILTIGLSVARGNRRINRE